MSGAMPDGVSIEVLEDISVPPAGYLVSASFDSIYLQAATGDLKVRWPNGVETRFPLFKKWRFNALIPGCRLIPSDGTSTITATVEHSAGVEMDDFGNRVDGTVNTKPDLVHDPASAGAFVADGPGINSYSYMGREATQIAGYTDDIVDKASNVNGVIVHGAFLGHPITGPTRSSCIIVYDEDDVVTTAPTSIADDPITAVLLGARNGDATLPFPVKVAAGLTIRVVLTPTAASELKSYGIWYEVL